MTSQRKLFGACKRSEWKVLAIALVTALGVFTAGIAAAPAAAQELSPGCRAVNDPGRDGYYWTSILEPARLFALGETITISASEPSSYAPTTLTLYEGTYALWGWWFDAVVLASASFPGTVQYVVPSTDTFQLRWGVDGFGTNATWTVSCESPAGEPAAEITDLQGVVSGLALEGGLGTAFQSKLDEALAALATGDTGTACSALQAFLNQVRAQAGKKLTTAQAQQLTDAANEIRTAIGC